MGGTTGQGVAKSDTRVEPAVIGRPCVVSFLVHRPLVFLRPLFGCTTVAPEPVVDGAAYVVHGAKKRR